MKFHIVQSAFCWKVIMGPFGWTEYTFFVLMQTLILLTQMWTFYGWLQFNHFNDEFFLFVFQILSYKEALTLTWETKQKFAREQTMGSYSNLYALLKAYGPKQPYHQSRNLQFKKTIRKKRLGTRLTLCSGRKDIRRKQNWKGLVDVSMDGYTEQLEKQWNATSESESDNEEEDEDEVEMIEYLNRPFISLDESLIADCSPSFISRNYHALKTLCSIEMKSKQQVYLYQEKGYVCIVSCFAGQSISQ